MKYLPENTRTLKKIKQLFNSTNKSKISKIIITKKTVLLQMSQKNGPRPVSNANPEDLPSLDSRS